MAEERKGGDEVPVQASGFATLGMGDNVVVQQSNGSWKPGTIVDCYDAYTVMYMDGKHSILNRKAFTIQRIVRPSRIEPGMDVLIPTNAEDLSAFNSGVVIEGGQTVRVVLGEQGVDWDWQQGGDGRIQALHNDSTMATLQVLNEDKEVSVPANQVFGGLHWMRLVGSGAEGIMVANNVLFQPRQTAPGGVETEFGFVRWAVPGSRGDPAQFTPFLSGHSILRAAATMFDLDGDGALNVAEYNSFTEAMFGLSALKDYGDADSDAAADAEDAKATAKDLKEMARGAGYDIEEGQALPLGAIPTLWKIRAAIRGKKTDQPPQERLQWELANVLVVRLGRGLKREHQVSTYEGRPEKTPADKFNKLLAALPKLYLAAHNPKCIAASAVLVGALKGALYAGTHPPEGLMLSIRESIKAAIVRAPRIVMTFVDMVIAAWNDAPELVQKVKDAVMQVVAQVKDVMGDAGLVAHAAILNGMQLGAQVVSAMGEAARDGAAVASGAIMQAHGAFVSGAAQKLGPITEDVKGMVGKGGAQAAAALSAAMKEMQTVLSRDSLNKLSDAATEMGDDARAMLPTLHSISINIGNSATEGANAVPEPDVDSESIIDAAKGAAAGAAGSIVESAEGAKGAMIEAASVVAANVPLAVAACRYALAETERFFRLAAKAGAPVADGAKTALTTALRTGLAVGGDVSVAVATSLKNAVASVAPTVVASTLAALRQASGALPAVATVQQAFVTAASEAKVVLRIMACPEAVQLLGGAGEAGEVVAASVATAFGGAVEAGAQISGVAAAQVKAAAADAAAFARVANAEAREAACKAAVAAHEASGNLDTAAGAALARAAAVASAGAAEARAAAALIKVKGLEAIQNAPSNAAELEEAVAAAAAEAQQAATQGLAEARLVASMMAKEAKQARSVAVTSLAKAAESGASVAALAGSTTLAMSRRAATEARVLAAAAAANAPLLAAEAAALGGAAAEGFQSATEEAYGALVDAMQTARGAAPGMVAQAADAARYAVASTEAAVAHGIEVAGPAVSTAAESVVAAQQELREAVAPGVSAAASVAAAGARAAARALERGAALAGPVIEQAFRAAIDALPDDVVNAMSAVLSTSINIGMQVFTKLKEVAEVAVQAAIEAGRTLAPFLPQIASAGAAAATAAATAAAAAAGTLADAAGNVAGLVSPAVATAGASLQQAFGEAGDLAGEAKEYLSDAAGAAGAAASGAVGAAAGAGASAAAAAGGAIATGAASVGAAGASALSSAVGVGQSFFNSGLAAGKDVVQWASVDNALAMSQEGLDNAKVALVAAAGGCFACCNSNLIGLDCIKFDIIRDFFQMVGLFFASMASKSMDAAKDIWGNLSNLVAVDLSFVFPTISPLVIYIAIGLVAVVLLVTFLVFMCKTSSSQPDAIREGHEVSMWSEQAESRKKTMKFLRLFLQGCLAAYLPVSRSVFQILVCERTMAKVFTDLGLSLCTYNPDGTVDSCKCNDWEPYLYLQIAAGILLLGFTIALPVRCYTLIKKNKPVGSREDPDFRYDEDGHKVPYTDDMYNMDLNTRPDQLKCPYLFLYKGYERRWAYYKVLVMVLKFCVCIPVIIFWDNIVIQTTVTLLLLALFSAASFYTSPFIDSNADRMDQSARVTAVCVLLFGFIGSKDVWESASGFWGVMIHVVNFINVAILILFTALGAKCCRRCMQDRLGAYNFHDTCLNVRGPAHDIVPKWQIEREVKHRVWHAFWTSVIMNKMDEAVQHRFGALQQRVADVGREKIEKHFDAIRTNPVRVQQRMWVQQNLEGVDVYFDGVSHDGHLDSVTKFGKMYINPFPFECVMVYDDCDDYTLLYEDDFDKFVNMNRDPDVVARRRNRQAVRALHGQMCRLEHQRDEMHSVPDGTETYTDSEGNQHTRTRYTTVSVRMSYTNGRMSVSANSDKQMAAGFKAALHYSDGQGVAIAPHTGQHHTIHNSYTMPMSEFGMDQTFRMTARLNELFSKNRPKIDAGLIPLHESTMKYRNELIAKRQADEDILSSGFWLFVYDNYKSSREVIEHYLRTSEKNEVLQTFPTTNKAGLDFLYSRMAWCFSHPCSSLWWVFFDDLWENNGEMKAMRDKREMFDSRCSESLAYHPMKREALEAKMEEAGLRNVPGCRGTKKMFNDSVLDALYDRMNALDQKHLRSAGNTPHV